MSRTVPFRDAQRIPFLLKRLEKPETDEEIKECAQVAHAVRRLELRRADVLLPVNDELPHVRVWFKHAPPPKVYWAKYLSLFIQLRNGDNWLGRLSHILPATKEMWFAPRPDGTHPQLAMDALRRNVPPMVSLLTFAVVFAQPVCHRQIVLTH